MVTEPATSLATLYRRHHLSKNVTGSGKGLSVVWCQKLGTLISSHFLFPDPAPSWRVMMTITTKGKEKERETSLFNQKKPEGPALLSHWPHCPNAHYTPAKCVYFLLGISKIQERWTHRKNGLPRWRKLMAFGFCAQHVVAQRVKLRGSLPGDKEKRRFKINVLSTMYPPWLQGRRNT